MLPITPPPNGRRQLSRERRRPRFGVERRGVARATRRARAGTSSRTAGAPPVGPRPRRTAAASTFADLSPSALIASRRSIASRRPLAGPDVRDRRVEHLGDPARSLDAVPRRRPRSRSRRSATNEKLHLLDDRDERRPPAPGRPRRSATQRRCIERVPPKRVGRERLESIDEVVERKRRIHSPFNHSSFARSNIAADGVTRSSVNAATISSAAHHLLSVVGRPAQQREVVDASPRGGYPCARKSSTRDRTMALGQLARDPPGRSAADGRTTGSGAPLSACADREDPVGGVDQVLTPDHVRDPHRRDRRPRWRGRRSGCRRSERSTKS